MFYLSKLLGHTVRDAEGKPAGTLQDVVVSTRQKYPRVTTLILKRGNRRLAAPWDDGGQPRGVGCAAARHGSARSPSTTPRPTSSSSPGRCSTGRSSTPTAAR